jgi:uncharacterized membrane protein
MDKKNKPAITVIIIFVIIFLIFTIVPMSSGINALSGGLLFIIIPFIFFFVIILIFMAYVFRQGKNKQEDIKNVEQNKNEDSKTYFKALGDFNFLKVFDEIIIRRSFKGEIFRCKISNIKAYYQTDDTVTVETLNGTYPFEVITYKFPVMLLDQFVFVIPFLLKTPSTTVTKQVTPQTTIHNPTLHDHDDSAFKEKKEESVKTYEDIKKEIDDSLSKESEVTKLIENQALLLSDLSNRFMKGEISMEEYVTERNKLMEIK